MNKEQYKELLIKLHRLEDDLVGAQMITDTTTLSNIVNRIENARQELLDIIKFVEKEND